MACSEAEEERGAEPWREIQLEEFGARIPWLIGGPEHTPDLANSPDPAATSEARPDIAERSFHPMAPFNHSVPDEQGLERWLAVAGNVRGGMPPDEDDRLRRSMAARDLRLANGVEAQAVPVHLL